MKCPAESVPTVSKAEQSMMQSSESLNERFLLLIQAVSGVRAFTSQETDNLTEAQLLDQLLYSLMQNLDLESCSIFLLEGGRLRCAAGKNWDEYINKTDINPNRNSHTFQVGQGVMGIAAEQGQVYHCQDCSLDENFLPIVNKDNVAATGSLISTPIMVGKECLGVLNVSHPDANFFHLWQEHILAILANILGRTLKRFRLMNTMHDQVSRRTEELQIALNESEILKQQFKTLSFVDHLTQLCNRRALFTKCPALLTKTIENDKPFSLLLLDVDNFKSINDIYGHEIGDVVLVEVSKLLKEASRAEDIVARIGGEEVAFVLPDTSLDVAVDLAEKIRSRIEALVIDESSPELVVTVSLGISATTEMKGGPVQTFSKMLRQADLALYACKDTGRNRCLTYEEIDKSEHIEPELVEERHRKPVREKLKLSLRS